MAKAVKLPSGNYRCKANYTDEYGKYKTKSFTAPTKKEAEYLAAQFKVKYEHDAKPENKTLRQLAEAYINDRSEVLSPSTIRGYRSIAKNAFSSILDVRMGRLTKDMYQRAVNEYAKKHSPKSVLSAHVFFNNILKQQGITVGETSNLPQREKKEIEIPSPKEMAAFLRNVQGTRMYLYCLFSVCGGLRKSETIALTWDDVDLNNRTVKITKARVRDEFDEYVLKTTKTYSGTRTIHISPPLFEALQAVEHKKGLLFPDSPKGYESMYQRQCKRWNFPYNFHALRHFYASVLVVCGVPNKYSQERMGHGTDDMLKKVYQHTFASEQEMYDGLVDEYFKQVITSATEEQKIQETHAVPPGLCSVEQLQTGFVIQLQDTEETANFEE